MGYDREHFRSHFLNIELLSYQSLGVLQQGERPNAGLIFPQIIVHSRTVRRTGGLRREAIDVLRQYGFGIGFRSPSIQLLELNLTFILRFEC